MSVEQQDVVIKASDCIKKSQVSRNLLCSDACWTLNVFTRFIQLNWNLAYYVYEVDQRIQFRGYAAMNFSKVTALYLDLLLCLFPDKTSRSFHWIMLKFCKQ